MMKNVGFIKFVIPQDHCQGNLEIWSPQKGFYSPERSLALRALQYQLERQLVVAVMEVQIAWEIIVVPREQ